MGKNRITLVHWAGLLTFGVAAMLLLFPEQSLNAALRGVSIWWDVLFPALLPFLVICEVMLGFGIVHFFGTLLDPMMRPLFRVPGIGGFVMAMGFASGYPVGAKLASKLWEQKLITRDEGERLVGFTTTSDPIFLIGAVSVGFFHNGGLAVVLGTAHYGSALLLGLLMRFHGDRETLRKPAGATGVKSDRSLLFNALRAMHRARLADGRDLGTLLRHAVQSSLQLIFVIGGLVVFFSVVLEVLTAGGIMRLLYACVSSVLHMTAIPQALSEAVVSGLFEVTLGAKAAGQSGEAISLEHKAAIAAFVLSWGGLSVHAQIISLVNHTGMRYVPFLLARLIHGLLAVVMVYILWRPLRSLMAVKPAFLPEDLTSSPFPSLIPSLLALSGMLMIGVLVLIPVLYLFYAFFSHTVLMLRRQKNKI